MDLRGSLRRNYHAGLRMLRQAVELCPDELWSEGTHPRTFWRIAYHAAFYTHLYLGQNEQAFKPWQHHRRDVPALWGDPAEESPYSREQILDYIDHVSARVDRTVDELDLETEDTGFDWYVKPTKLDHQIMNIRHLQGHVGQLSEILMSHGIDLDWVAIGDGPIVDSPVGS